MWYHYYDAQTELERLEYELGYCYSTGEASDENVDERYLLPERSFPISPVTAWIAGLYVISLGLGLASQWLVQ
jgi:hypothetical protein